MIEVMRNSVRDAAPLSESEPVKAEPEAEAAAPLKRSFYPRTFLMMFFGVTVPVIVLDQASKLYIAAHMHLYETIVLIPNLLDLTYALNPGASFSLFADLPAGLRLPLLSGLSMIAIVVLIVLLLLSERPTLTSVALALILAGAAGNLIDRAVHGQVIDFVRAHYYAYSWPIFNVADSAISIGVALILLGSIVSSRAARQN
jgi:signal peptidase II